VFRSSGSVGGNNIEASDDLGKPDEKMRIKISGREAKECIHRFDLILANGNSELEMERLELIDEANQIKKILVSCTLCLVYCT
jgi:four helix bundle protein